MQTMMENWKKPLFERKSKPMLADDLEQMHNATVMPHLENIKTNGKEIHKLMKDTSDNIKPDKKSLIWLAYVDYVNGLIIDGMTNGINASMDYLSSQIDINYTKHNMLSPMFDVKVDLVDRVVTFEPQIGSTKKNSGIKDIIIKIIHDFISISI
jgi:dynein heavy chain